MAYKMELAALFNPVYDGLNVNFEAFYVPNRIVDPRFKTFWTGYDEFNPINSLEILPLRLDIEYTKSGQGSFTIGDVKDAPLFSFGCGSLSDFLGVQFRSYYNNGFPAITANSFNLHGLNAYKYLGYHKIVDEFYINTRLEDTVLGYLYNQPDFLTGSIRSITAHLEYLSTNNTLGYVNDGELNLPDILKLRQRNYAKDAFTTALPWPELGGEQVRIPIGDTGFGSVARSGDVGSLIVGGSNTVVSNTSGSDITVPSNAPRSGSSLSLSAAALGTIAQLKMAFKEYAYAMKDLYKGPRYIENIFAHYGESINEGLVQRPIYLGSVRDYVNFGQVFQTAPSASTDEDGNELGVGDYSGRGSVEGAHKIFENEFQEPGYIYVLFSISPNARYFQGIDRSNIKRSRKDWFSPEYQNIGEDFVSNHELCLIPFDGITPSTSLSIDVTDKSEGVFGWQQRWYDLKWYKDELHGNFAKYVGTSESPTSFNSSQQTSWIFSRPFVSVPVLGPTFVKTSILNAPFITTDVNVDNYNVDMAFDITAYRKIQAVETF